jgi:predicted DNA-binding protein with PD1-like motif
MKYQVGRPGRVVVIRFDDKEEFLEKIKEVVKKEDIKSAVIYIIGGLRRGDIVVGSEKDVISPKPVWKRLSQSHEVVCIGTLFREKKEPRIHLHGVFGRKNTVKAGCLRGIAETFLIIEAIVLEIKGIKAKRELDPVSGLSLLRL